MFFRITQEDLHQSKLKGADTVRLCEMQGITPRLKTDDAMRSRTENNQRAFAAEYLFARLFSLDPPVVNVASDGGIDFWLGDISVDVKCSNSESGPLIFDSMAKFKADVAVAYGATDEPDKFKLHGCVSKQLFGRQSYEKDFGHGTRLVMDVADLSPIELLWGQWVRKEMSVWR
jgi:hypothetical protein